MYTRPQPEPRGCKSLLPWSAGTFGSMDKRGGFWFSPWSCPPSRTVRGPRWRKRLNGVPGQAHSPPCQTSSSRYPHIPFSWPMPPRKPGSLSALARHQLPRSPSLVCRGRHSFAFYSISTPRSKMSTTNMSQEHISLSAEILLLVPPRPVRYWTALWTQPVEAARAHLQHCPFAQYWVTSRSLLALHDAEHFTQSMQEREERGYDPWVRKVPWRRKWQLIPVLLPGKSHRQRSLESCSPWGRKDSDTTERLTFSLSQCCLGNHKRGYRWKYLGWFRHTTNLQ